MDKQTKNRQTRPRSSAESRPPLPKFSEYVEVEAHYIFHPSTIWVRPLFTELGPKKTQKAYFAMKQTNICRLSGDIIIGLRMGIPLRYLSFQKNSSLDEMEKWKADFQKSSELFLCILAALPDRGTIVTYLMLA